MVKGSIIFHKTLLWGIVTKVENDFFTIYFESFGERVISKEFIDLDKKMLVEIPEEFIKKLNSDDLFSDFKLQTIERGERYYKEGRIERFYIKNGRFYAKVTGSNSYDVLIKFKTEFLCTCPVVINCKHSVAVLLVIKDIINRLREIDLNNTNSLNANENIIRNTGKSLYSNYFLFNEYDYVGIYPIFKFKEYVNSLISFNNDEKLAFLIELNNYLDKAIILLYVKLFVLSSRLSNYVDFICDNKDLVNNIYNTYYRNKTRIINGIGYPLNNSDRESILFNDFINGRYESLMVNYFTYYGSTSSLVDYLKEALLYVSDEELNRHYDDLKIRGMTDISNCNLIIDRLNEENLVLMSNSHAELLQKNNRMNRLTIDSALRVLNCFNSDYFCKYIENNYERYLSKPREFALLLKNKYYVIPTPLKKIIINIFEKLPHSRYLVPAIEKRYQQTEPLLLEELLNDKNTSKPSYMKINTDDLFYYFDLKYNVYERNNEIHLEINLNFENISIASAKKIDNDYYLESLEVFSDLHLGNFILDYAMDNYGENINNDIEKTKDSIKKKKFEEDFKVLENAIDSFSSSMKNMDTNISRGEKAKLDIYMSSDNPRDLTVKIGIKQMYKIKSLGDLLDSFLCNETKKYGKNLIFSHNPDNLIEPYSTLIKYLIEIYFEMDLGYRTYYGVALKDSNMNKVFNILDKSYIYLDDKPILINLEKKPVRYFIDENYVIKFKFDYKYKLLFMSDYVYIINYNSNEINLADINKNEIPLLKFFYNNNNLSIEPIKEKFRDVIYSRFIDKIEIDSTLSNDFKINNVEINAYFDWYDENISVKNTFEKDGEIILPDKLIQGGDLSKVNTYNEYLKQLGFVDGLMSNEEDQLEFFKMDFSYLRSLANVYLSDTINNKSVSNINAPIVRIQYENNMLEAFLVESEYSEEELKNIFKALKRKRKFALLGENKIIDLDNPEAMEFYQTIKDLRINESKPLERYTLPVYQALKAYAHSNNCEIDEYLENMVNEISTYKDSNILLPKVDAKLRDYQVSGYKWLSVLKKYHMGGILADDMGLGKTLQIITLILADLEKRPSLVVCPKSLIFNWKTEFNKFAPSLIVKEIYGNQAERRDVISNISEDEKVIYIISYDSLGRDIEFIKQGFNFLILDEAQAIKNVNAKKSVNVKIIKASYRYALTGTPIENNVIDLWSIFDFLMPQYFEDLSAFKSRYLHDPNYTDSIAKKVAPFILRRTKKDVLKDLPPKFERIVTCEMNNEQRKLYDSICNEAKDRLMIGGKAFDVLPLLTRLRQICIDPSMFLEDYFESSAKMELLEEIITEYLANSHRILIFSQFVKALEIIEKFLKEKGIEYYKITGDTDAKDRLMMCNKFNNNNTPIFLISLKAGGTGLNLVGADTVIHVDPWWNSSAENQATDRAHRIGQTRNVEVIKLICENSIEQRVLELQNMKKDIIDKLIANNDERISSISLSDLQFILN